MSSSKSPMFYNLYQLSKNAPPNAHWIFEWPSNLGNGFAIITTGEWYVYDREYAYMICAYACLHVCSLIRISMWVAVHRQRCEFLAKFQHFYCQHCKDLWLYIFNYPLLRKLQLSVKLAGKSLMFRESKYWHWYWSVYCNCICVSGKSCMLQH